MKSNEKLNGYSTKDKDHLNSFFKKICGTKVLFFFLVAAFCGALFGFWWAIVGLIVSVIFLRAAIIITKSILLLVHKFYNYLMSRD